MARSYKEAAKYEDTPKQVRNRESRNKARSIMEHLGKATKGDSMDVDHIKPLSKGGNTVEQNLRVISQHNNRSFHRQGHTWHGPADSLAAQHLTGKENKPHGKIQSSTQASSR